MKEWTREEIERLVKEPVIKEWLLFHLTTPGGFSVIDDALLQTRLDLETARNDIVDGGLSFNDKVIECSRLSGALERIATSNAGANNCTPQDFILIRGLAREALKGKA